MIHSSRVGLACIIPSNKKGKKCHRLLLSESVFFINFIYCIIISKILVLLLGGIKYSTSLKYDY